MEPWESFHTLFPLIFAILGMIGNAIRETYFVKKPFTGPHTGATTQGFLVCAPLSRVGLTAGHGLVLNAQNFATQAIAMLGDDAQAAAMYAFFRAFGMALGVGIGGSVFQNVMNIRLSQYGLPESIARNAEAYIAVLWHSNSTTPNTEPILNSYTYGIDGVFGLLCGIAGFTGIASLFIGHFNLDRARQTEHTLVENRLTTHFDNISRPHPEKDRNSRPVSHMLARSRPSSRGRDSHIGGPSSPVVLVTGSGDSKPVLHLTIPSSSFASNF